MTCNNSHRRLVLLLLLLLAIPTVSSAFFSVPRASALTEAPGFDILNVFWGTSSAHASAGPGSQNVPLTVVAEYTYYLTADTILANLSLPLGFTDNNGGTVASSYVSGNTQAGTLVQFIFYLDIASNASLGVYSMPFGLSWLTGSADTLATTVQYTSIVLPLKGTVSLGFAATQKSLVPGELNSLEFTVENSASGDATSVSVVVSSSSQATVVTQPATIKLVGAGSSVSGVVGVFVPSSAAGTAVTLTFTSTYIDPYNYTETSTASMGLLISTFSANGAQLSFKATQGSLAPGEVDEISVTVSNIGTTVARDVSIAVTATQGATVIAEPPEISSLAPGASTAETLNLFVPTSAGGSAITLTFSSTYLDINNNTDSSMASLGLLVSSTQSTSNVLLEFQSVGKPLTPGSVNEVTVTVTNVGTTLARQLGTVVSASGGATVLTQPSVVEDLGPGASATETLTLFVPTSSGGSAISLSLSSTYLGVNNDTDSSSQTLGLSVTSTSLPAFEASSTAASIALIPGQVNTIPVDIENIGTGSATDIMASASASAQSGSVEVVSPPTISSLEPGSSALVNVTLFVAPSASDSPITLSFSLTYLDEYGQAQSAVPTLGLQAESAAQVFADVSLAVSPMKNSVVAGTTSTVSFVVENVGKSAIYSPVFTLSPSQPLITVGNSTFSAIGTVINPGQGQTFYATLTASPSATTGIYSGTLSIGFANQNGVADTQSYSVDFLLSGPIELVVQNEQFSQNGSDVTVTGNILNEGLSPGYYASVSGYLNASKATGQPDYVGEIDVNSPVPFSVTIPYQAQSSGGMGNVTLVVQYKNSLGQVSNSSTSDTAQLQSLGQIISPSSTGTKPTSQGGPSLLEIVLLATIGLVAVGTFVVVVVRRRIERKVEHESGKSAAEQGSARVS